MSDELIQGRNLIMRGRFPSDWKVSWVHNKVGAAVIAADPTYGAYLMTNKLAEVTQEITLPIFTETQMPGVSFRVALQYENYNEGPGAGVLITTSKGLHFHIDLSGKKSLQPLAEWNPYPFQTIPDVTADDRSLELKIQAPDISGSSGLRVTDFSLDILLAPLQVQAVHLDGKVYPSA